MIRGNPAAWVGSSVVRMGLPGPCLCKSCFNGAGLSRTPCIESTIEWNVDPRPCPTNAKQRMLIYADPLVSYVNICTYMYIMSIMSIHLIIYMCLFTYAKVYLCTDIFDMHMCTWIYIYTIYPYVFVLLSINTIILCIFASMYNIHIHVPAYIYAFCRQHNSNIIHSWLVFSSSIF